MGSRIDVVGGVPALALPVPPAPNGAAATVTSGFQVAQTFASTAFNQAQGLIAGLGATAAALKPAAIDVILAPIATAITAYQSPALPAAPAGLALNLPTTPTDPTLTPVALPTLDAAPAFTATMLPIDLSFAVPTALTATVPTAPVLPAVMLPASPTVVLPDVPSLVGITIPTMSLLNLPTFAAIMPDSPQAAAFTFSFMEPTYTSVLLTALRARLLEWVDGASTGIAPVVEQALWQRGRTRENALLARKAKEAIRTYASRGFSKPPGALSLEIADAMQDTQNTLSALSRDVMVKQADLEQSNRRFAFENAWKVEEGLITYQNQIAQRAYETAKYTQQVAVDIYHENVLRFTAEIQGYGVQVEVYKAQITAELGKLEIFKAELEGQKLIGEINLQAIEVYKARIEGVKAVIDIFKAQVEAANVSANVNKTQIEAFAAQVGAYGEVVRAKAAEYDMYATRVKTEAVKVDMFKSQADAYDSQVHGFKALVDAQVAVTGLAVKVNQEVPLDLFKTRTEVFRTLVSAESERVGALVKVYDANVNVFSAEVQGEKVRVDASVEEVKAETAVAVAQGNLTLESLKANVQAMVQEVQVLVEAIKGGAQVAAQLAAAALSSVNLSAQLGSHEQYSVGFSNGNTAHNAYQGSMGDQTSDITYHHPSD